MNRNSGTSCACCLPGDLAGVQFWINHVTSGAPTREQVRRAFVASPEFRGRVAAIIAQGCLQ